MATRSHSSGGAREAGHAINEKAAQIWITPAMIRLVFKQLAREVGPSKEAQQRRLNEICMQIADDIRNGLQVNI